MSNGITNLGEREPIHVVQLPVMLLGASCVLRNRDMYHSNIVPQHSGVRMHILHNSCLSGLSDNSRLFL